MINIMFSGRRRPGQSLAAFYHEFEATHVDLMRQARCERFLNRYVQNKVVPILPPIELWADIDHQVDSQACLAFNDLQSMGGFFSDPQYNQIVKPHEFIDPDYMTFELSEESKIKSGQVNNSTFKVIYYLKPQPEISRARFRTLIDGPYSELAISKRGELLALHMRSYCFPEDQTSFAKSSLPKARISQYGVVEELWFNSLEDIQRFHLGLKQNIHQKLSDGIDFKNSFSLVTTDRLVFGTRP